MKQIGIHQLVLETDLEDSTNVWDDLNRGVEGIALALDMDVSDVAEVTYQNAQRLYDGYDRLNPPHFHTHYQPETISRS